MKNYKAKCSSKKTCSFTPDWREIAPRSANIARHKLFEEVVSDCLPSVQLEEKNLKRHTDKYYRNRKTGFHTQKNINKNRKESNFTIHNVDESDNNSDASVNDIHLSLKKSKEDIWLSKKTLEPSSFKSSVSDINMKHCPGTNSPINCHIERRCHTSDDVFIDPCKPALVSKKEPEDMKYRIYSIEEEMRNLTVEVRQISQNSKQNHELISRNAENISDARSAVDEKLNDIDVKIDQLEKFDKCFSDELIVMEQVKKQFENFLSSKSSVEKNLITEYIHGFISQCTITYNAALGIRSGSFVLKLDDSATDLARVGAQLASLIPVIGGATGAFLNASVSVADYIKKEDIKHRANIILKQYMTEDIFIIKMKEVVLYILQHEGKLSTIYNIENQNHWLKSSLEYLVKTKDIVTNIFNSTSFLYKMTDQYQLGYQDAAKIMEKSIFFKQDKQEQEDSISYMADIAIGEARLTDSRNKEESKQEKSIDDAEDDMHMDQHNDTQAHYTYQGSCVQPAQPATSVKVTCCNIFSVGSIVYDDHLLNRIFAEKNDEQRMKYLKIYHCLNAGNKFSTVEKEEYFDKLSLYSSDAITDMYNAYNTSSFDNELRPPIGDEASYSDWYE